VKKRYPIKKIFLFVAAFFCLLALSYKLFFYADHASETSAIAENKLITRLSTNEMAQLHEGDFILRKGFGYFSDIVAKNLNHGSIDVTHAGIVVKRNNNWFVIHALSSDVSDIDGMQIQPLADFLSYSAPYKIIVTRAKNADVVTGKQIAQLAEGYLAKQVPFDHKGVIDDASKLFCTELIWVILEKDLHNVILPKDHEAREKLLYAMDAMYSTDYFDIVINQYQK
jgi:hypothetical protein